jgi:hypothetical protein
LKLNKFQSNKIAFFSQAPPGAGLVPGPEPEAGGDQVQVSLSPSQVSRDNEHEIRPPGWEELEQSSIPDLDLLLFGFPDLDPF